MFRFASLKRWAITRLRPITLISSVAAAGAVRGAAGRAPGTAFGALRSGVGCARRATYDSRSFGTMRPLGPEPAIRRRATPASGAGRRMAGEVAARPVRVMAGAAAVVAGGGAVVADAAVPGAAVAAAPLPPAPALAAGALAELRALAVVAGASGAVSNTMR